MKYPKFIVYIALVGVVIANPRMRRKRCNPDTCLAAVTGKVALDSDIDPANDCKSYLATTITPEDVTVTTTVVQTGTIDNPDKWKRAPVTMSRNGIPQYATACENDEAYASACICFGQTSSIVTTIAPVTTTMTVNAEATESSVPDQGDQGWKPVCDPGKCLTADKVQYLIDSFKNLLEFTDYNGTQGPKGRGFDTELAETILAPDFQDISDSINYLAQLPIGDVTFSSRMAFIAGQSSQPEVVITVLSTWFSCNTITFRYRIMTGAGGNIPVTGINIMEVDNELEQIKTQYAEFNNGAWLANLGNPQCKTQG